MKDRRTFEATESGFRNWESRDPDERRTVTLEGVHEDIRIFRAGSHSPFYEEPEAYRSALVDFLRRHKLGSAIKSRSARAIAGAG